jgi:hypothetical protein
MNRRVAVTADARPSRFEDRSLAVESTGGRVISCFAAKHCKTPGILNA